MASRADAEFFDQKGVQELRETLIRQSAASVNDQHSPSSDDGTQGFNFEQVLQDKVQK